MTPDSGGRSTRRHFLAASSLNIGSVALAWLLQDERASGAPSKPMLEREVFDLQPKQPPARPQATAMISLFMQGGPSHIDLFEPKPELDKRNGQDYVGEIKYDDAVNASTQLLASRWKFSKHGECGMELSSLLPHTAEIVDDITLIRSMRTAVQNHPSSTYAMNTGRPVPGRPSLGSWLTYGLGSTSQDLPAYVVLTNPEKLPTNGVLNWSNGWLPSLYQGTYVRPREPRIPNLDPPVHLRGRPQRELLSFLADLNREHLEKHPGEHDLEARIASYELGARMQLAAAEALDISRESAATHRMYGLDDPLMRDFGTQCLIARRLIERGVRFVQVYLSQDNWDHHQQIFKLLPEVCRKSDQPSAALVKDLKARGLLDTTLVHWGGEMGRLPVIQKNAEVGRDHNTFGFSMWLAGGGVKGGHVHGATDDFGVHAVQDVVNHYDYQATLLHLFGLDHEQFVFKRSSGEATMTDGQGARVIHEILERSAS